MDKIPFSDWKNEAFLYTIITLFWWLKKMYKKIAIIVVLAMGMWSFVSAAVWNLSGVKIIPRAQWWANETRRYAPESKIERDKVRQQQKEAELNQLMENDSEKFFNTLEQQYQWQFATDYLLETTPEEQVVDEYREKSNGNYLKWPESIHKQKSKIIIHHTADDFTVLLTWGTDAVIKQLQDIYKYHTLTRRRWDIWYNFVIDPYGNIYEGRAGGAWVVWAQTAWNNTPSVGISLMGNFNVNVPTDDSLKSLVTLTTALAKKYKINPKATTYYYKKSNEAPYLEAYKNYTIAWHIDAWVTSCPGTNLYNVFPEIRDQVSKNLTTYSLVSSRKVVAKPAVNVWTVVDGRYYSDKTADTFALPIRWTGVKSCKAIDSSVGITSCRSSNNQLLISVNKNWISGLKTVSAVTASGTKLFSFNLIWKDDFDSIANKLKQGYITTRWLSSSTKSINKISYKIPLSELTTLVQSPLNILLYELSMNYPRFELSCDGWCTIQVDDKTYTETKPLIETSNGFIYLTLPSLENPLTVTNLKISSVNWWLVSINNYTRKSYGGVAWNSFRGSLIWKKESIRNLSSWKFSDQAVVINKVSFDDYMKGIAETSDSENTEKQKLILLLAKMYTLFYINGKNVHSSIPAGASYQAIDHPDIFQKYVGAGREKTSTVSPWLLSEIKDIVVMYDNYVPILPYFSCSAGFTWSAKEKWWWNDTPYLQSKLDFNSCFNFNGHGVGLSGKWAQFLAEKWRDYKQILQYYYPGVTITSL